jgi:hypothetical protein
MAILGGAGNVAGSNPTGVGQGLNYIGEHIYGFSGIVLVGDSEVALIDTTMGSGYSVLHLDFGTGSVSSRDMLWIVYLDEQEVYSYVSSGTNQAGANPQNHIQILVPGYSKFKITAENVSDSNTEKQSVVIMGRQY